MEEIDAVARLELCHIMFLFRPVFARTHNMPENHDGIDNDFFSQDDLVGEEYFNQVRCCLNEYIKRGWL